MIHTVIRRGGFLVAATALAGAAFAGSASAGTGYDSDPHQSLRDNVTNSVSGMGGAGGVSGGVSQDNCTAVNVEPLLETNLLIGALGLTQQQEQDDAIQCVVITGDASGGPGIEGE